MTREEAIKNLEHYRYCLDFQFGWFGEDDNEAIDMAISALKGGDAKVRDDRTYINEPYMQQSRPDDGRMTKEEAILILGEFKEFCDSILWDSIYAERSRAIDMAIESLSTPNGDLISRADAIEVLAQVVFDEPPYLDSESLCREFAENKINALPSAENSNAKTQNSNQETQKSNGDLISREVLMDRLESFCKWCKDGRLQGAEFVWDCIVPNVPSADRPKGEWIDVEDYNGDIHYKCDQCGEEWTFPFGTPKENNANFCPCCGAIMIGGDD